MSHFIEIDHAQRKKKRVLWGGPPPPLSFLPLLRHCDGHNVIVIKCNIRVHRIFFGILRFPLSDSTDTPQLFEDETDKIKLLFDSRLMHVNHHTRFR